MKIGIYAGTIPPPVFINNLINGLADKIIQLFCMEKPQKEIINSQVQLLFKEKFLVQNLELYYIQSMPFPS